MFSRSPRVLCCLPPRAGTALMLAGMALLYLPSAALLWFMLGADVSSSSVKVFAGMMAAGYTVDFFASLFGIYATLRRSLRLLRPLARAFTWSVGAITVWSIIFVAVYAAAPKGAITEACAAGIDASMEEDIIQDCVASVQASKIYISVVALAMVLFQIYAVWTVRRYITHLEQQAAVADGVPLGAARFAYQPEPYEATPMAHAHMDHIPLSPTALPPAQYAYASTQHSFGSAGKQGRWAV